MENKCKIAIIDTGFDFQTLLGNRIQKSINFIDDGDAIDDSGHGTCLFHMLDSLSENILFYNFKILDRNKRGRIKDLKKALKRAISYNVNIINLSLGLEIDMDIELESLFEICEKKNILLISTFSNFDSHNNLTKRKDILLVDGLSTLIKDELYIDSTKGVFYLNNTPRIVPWSNNQFIFSGAKSFLTPYIVKFILSNNIDFRGGVDNVKYSLSEFAKKIDLDIHDNEKPIFDKNNPPTVISSNSVDETLKILKIYSNDGKINFNSLTPYKTTQLVNFIHKKTPVKKEIYLDEILTYDMLLRYIES